MAIHPREGVVKEKKFPNARKPSHWRVCGEFWNLRGQHSREEKTKTKTKNPQITRLTSTPSGEVAQTLASINNEWGLNREVQATLLKVRNGPECPEGNLRELT